MKKDFFDSKKGDIPFWLVSLIIVLITMIVIIFIITGAGKATFDGIGFIKDLF